MEKRITRSTIASTACFDFVELPPRDPLSELPNNDENIVDRLRSKASSEDVAKKCTKRKQPNDEIEELKEQIYNKVIKLGRNGGGIVAKDAQLENALKTTPVSPNSNEEDNKTIEEDDQILEKPSITIVHCTNISIEQSTDSRGTWYAIQPRAWQIVPREQGRHFELPLIKLANASTSLQLPSPNWHIKIKLNEWMPKELKRHTLTIFTGDLKVHDISEKNRYKYQPDCVIFRRDGVQHRYDRVVIFRSKGFSIGIDGTLVHLDGAPEAVKTLQEVEILLDIIDSIDLSNPMVEIVTAMSLTEQDVIKESYTNGEGKHFD